MAERRMFAKTIIDSDAFLDMPMSARLLYYDLGMRGDDDGFINSPKKIMRMIGVSDDDMRLLISKKFVIPFESGVVVIKHWKIHNYIRKDTYKETNYKEEKSTLSLDENNSYVQRKCPKLQDCDSCVDEPSTQDRLGKDRLGKDSEEESKQEKLTKPTHHEYGEYKNVLLTDEQFKKLAFEIPNYQQYIEKVSEYCASSGKTYKNYLATIRNWYKRDKKKEQDKEQSKNWNKQQRSYDIEKIKEKARGPLVYQSRKESG